MLVIDDDPGVRALIRRLLLEAGHDVLEAGDGAAALKLMEDHPTDVVVTDVYMPGMDGFELALKLRRMRVRPAVVAVSGGGFGSQVDMLDVAAQLGAAATLPKPFSKDQLLAALEQALARGEST